MGEMGRFKDCVYWTRYKNPILIKHKGSHAGECDHKGFVNDNVFPIDGLMYWDYEGYGPGLCTCEYFGCIHWEPRS